MKKAFTLIELLIVIAIIGVLAGVLLVSTSGVTESARSAKCLANLRNLATACRSYGLNNNCYPLAASVQYSYIDESQGIKRAKMVYGERKGWISWYSAGAYADSPTSSVGSSGFHKSAYDTDTDAQYYCLTNGAIWKYVGENTEVYVCPSHVKAAQRSGVRPWWSYEMNGYFGGDVGLDGSRTVTESYGGIGFTSLKHADRVLLFAEMDFENVNAPCNDTAIQYENMSGISGDSEGVAFNHYSGKRKCAHAVFADGHMEKMLAPKADQNYKELMEWLCEGIDVSFNGRSYEKMEN